MVMEDIKTDDLKITFTKPPYTEHKHEHTHEDGTTNSHEHTHEGSEETHDHEHVKEEIVKSKKPQVKSGKIHIPEEAKKGKDFTINFGKKWEKMTKKLPKNDKKFAARAPSPCPAIIYKYFFKKICS